jgi:hypothetical protein
MKRELSLSEVKELVGTLLSTDDEEDDDFKAGVVLIAARFQIDVPAFTGYGTAFVDRVTDNCVKNGIWGPNAFEDTPSWTDEKDFSKMSTEFSLLAMSASGGLIRRRAPNGEALYSLAVRESADDLRNIPWGDLTYDQKMKRIEDAKRAWTNYTNRREQERR